MKKTNFMIKLFSDESGYQDKVADAIEEALETGSSEVDGYEVEKIDEGVVLVKDTENNEVTKLETTEDEILAEPYEEVAELSDEPVPAPALDMDMIKQFNEMAPRFIEAVNRYCDTMDKQSDLQKEFSGRDLKVRLYENENADMFDWNSSRDVDDLMRKYGIKKLLKKGYEDGNFIEVIIPESELKRIKPGGGGDFSGVERLDKNFSTDEDIDPEIEIDPVIEDPEEDEEVETGEEDQKQFSMKKPQVSNVDRYLGMK